MRFGKINISQDARNYIILIGLIIIQFMLLHLWWLTIFTIAILGFILFFFRDPPRIVPPLEQSIVSAADGTVVDITEVYEAQFLHQPVKRVSIFLSIFDVHVNRSPVKGEVKLIQYQPGRFKNALSRKSSQYNEHNLVGIENGKSQVLVKQIAGFIARRIVCHCDVGDQVAAGERIGLIKFGSRVEIFLPLAAQLQVKLKDKVKAGETIIALLPPKI
ncbi:MAG: phosphatidylserine decarboxylase family protein [bacterium]|nr:phosphatidylserine decarboxylase family protein [bacterium]